MYNRTFFGTQLGKASLASIAAMVAMILLTSQMNLSNSAVDIAQPHTDSPMLVELA